jgi:hypothetical protein
MDREGGVNERTYENRYRVVDGGSMISKSSNIFLRRKYLKKKPENSVLNLMKKRNENM